PTSWTTSSNGWTTASSRRMGIPIVAVVDTNCNPEGIDYPIPGNDDAIRAITLFTSIIANAVIEADNEQGLKIIENLQDEDEELLEGNLSVKAEDEEIVDYSNYTPTEPKEEDEDANDDDLVDEDKLYK
ncbi:MAG: 30S ribosomal protein S2, partial [Treponemataceae bacterium]|nr:30S ribosomal protein S2 [Treponemataceae bacterium]